SAMKRTRLHPFGNRRFVLATRQSRSCALRRSRRPFGNLPALSITSTLKLGLWALARPLSLCLGGSGTPRRAASRALRPPLLCQPPNPVGIRNPAQSPAPTNSLLLRYHDLRASGGQLTHQLGIRRRIGDHQIHLVDSGAWAEMVWGDPAGEHWHDPP